jgi:7-cyano-7-deazaguanine tRNA-ribosyltransferase
MRVLRTGRRTIETPAIWLGHDIKNPFHVWTSLPGSFGLMVNANQVLERHWFRKIASEIGVHNALEFNGPVFLDSGGFQLQRKPELKSSPSKVLELQAAIRPDLTALLDFPLDPCASSLTNRRRWNKTLRSAKFMRSHCNENTLAPVLHSYSPHVIGQRVDQLHALFQRPPAWCLGSLVPLLRGSYIGSRFATPIENSSRLKRRWRLITNLICHMRAAIGDAALHVFGAGSLSTIFLLFLAGADSVDSSSWRVKAAFGAIQLPGLADRFLITRKDHSRVRKILTTKCRDILSQCACPVCRDLAPEKQVRELRRYFEARATHNAYVLISEITELRQSKQNGKLAEFVLNRLAEIPLYRNVARDVILPLVS